MESLRTSQGFCSIFIVTGMTKTHMGILLLNVFPMKEIKSYKMCLVLLCCSVSDGAGTALHASGKVETGGEVFSPATRSGPQGTQGSGTCTRVHTHPQQGGNSSQAAPHPWQGALPHHPNPNGNLLRLGRTSLPIYWVFTVPTYRISRVLS